MTARDIEQLEQDARKPDRGAKYHKPGVILALIAELRKTQMFALALLELNRKGQAQQFELFPEAIRKNDQSTH
jgi:hypothetical protein